MGSDHHIKVLLVEDNSGDADLIKIMLAGEKSYRFAVAHADRLSTGLAHLKNIATDVLLLDLSLPDSEGSDSFSMVHDCFPDMPTIILTGNHDETLAPQLVRGGAQDFLVKSDLNTGELVRAIRYAIQRQQLTHELEERNKEIEASRSRLHQIITDNADAIVLLDPNGAIQFSNPAATRLLGRRSDDLRGVPFGYPIVVDGVTELDIIRRDGRQCIAEMQVVWTNWEGHEAYLATLRDVTARKNLEAQLRQTQKLESLGVMASGIAHDFNNILTGILGYGNLVLEDLEPGTTQRANMKTLIESAERAAELSKLMLAYTGQGLRATLSLDINMLIHDMGDIFASIIPNTHDVFYSLDDESPFVDGDPSQLRQVIVNLMLNASEAIGESDGQIEISTGEIECTASDLKRIVFGEQLEPGTYVYFEVRDSGCGIDEVSRTKLFDPFFTTKFTGRGLGLAATSGIVRAHGGGILVSSEPGKGATFTVVLSPSANPVPESPRRMTRKGDWHGSGTILVVDDEPPIRDTLKRTLARFGFSVLLAENGEQGVDIFRAHSHEIVASIIDMTMPGLDGQETLCQIREICSDARVILSSGYSEDNCAEYDAELKPDAFLQKPYRAMDFITMLRGVLEGNASTETRDTSDRRDG